VTENEREQLRPNNNIRLDEIAHLTNLNSSIGDFNVQLNHVVWNDQTVRLEEGINRIQEQFRGANDAVRGQLLMDMDRYEMSLGREERNISQIQDPEGTRRRGRTFGRGGQRLPTGGEVAEKGLQRYDSQSHRRFQRNPVNRTVDQASPKAEIIVLNAPIHNRTSTLIPSRQTAMPSVFQSEFPYSRVVVDPVDQTLNVNESSDEEIVVLEVQSVENYPSPNVASRPIRQMKRPSLFQGELLQPRKRMERRIKGITI
jgi:hypothetical protein